MATTGFILAAMDAGIIPESTPSITQIENASVMISVEITIGKGNTPLSARANSSTIARPMSPPTMQRNALSSRNSVSMVRLLAPMAFKADLAGTFPYGNKHNICYTERTHDKAKAGNGPAADVYRTEKPLTCWLKTLISLSAKLSSSLD